MRTKQFLSLLCCLLMMCAAALCVNRTLFGKNFNNSPQPLAVSPDNGITALNDETTVIHTRNFSKAQGYAGLVPLDIYITNGNIDSIVALENSETPSFFARTAPLLNAWNGKSVREAAEMEPDAISGATYSSLAIIENVESGIAAYMNADSAKHANSMPLKMWCALAVVLAACIVPLFVKNRIYLKVQLVANVIVLGFWAGQFLDYTLMLKYLSNGFSLPAALTAIVMLIAAFIYPLFGRRQHYCTHICPFGAAQMLVASFCTYKIKISPKILKGLDNFRKILWAVLMLLLWTDTASRWPDLELFQAFMFQSAPAGIIIAAGVFIALSAIVSRPYCRFVCPTGSLFKCAENI
ncbi:MAG: 4Fe-4S binding protein [Muribaculaceae bacterium]|nr:4Fe-4S binding protein [Muribaculaceae bacterium]